MSESADSSVEGQEEGEEDLSPHLDEQHNIERKRNKKANARNELRQRFMANLTKTREGREWIWDLLSLGHVFATSFVPGDPTATAFKEGERNLALSVMAQVPPDAMKQMLEEASEYGT